MPVASSRLLLLTVHTGVPLVAGPRLGFVAWAAALGVGAGAAAAAAGLHRPGPIGSPSAATGVGAAGVAGERGGMGDLLSAPASTVCPRAGGFLPSLLPVKPRRSCRECD